MSTSRARGGYDRPVRDSFDAAEWFLKRVLIAGLVVLVVAVGLVFVLKRFGPASGAAPATGQASPGAAEQQQTITLAVHFPDGFHATWAGLAYTPNMTVLDAMVAAKGHRRPLMFTFTGSGTTAFLTSLEGLANESGGSAAGGGPGSARFWQFWINGRFATSGMGAAMLNPGDRVTWVFEPYHDNPKPPTP